MLQSAVVDCRGGDLSVAPDARTFLSFMGAPNLRNVSLRGATTGYDSLPLHSQTLNHLSILDGIEVREALAILQRSPKLQTCNLRLNSVERLDSPRPCHLEHLSQLCLDDWSLAGASFFGALVLPSLRRLEYACNIVDKGPSLPFLNLLSPGNCLECLSLNVGELPAESVLEALRLVPMLQELHMAQGRILPPDGWGDPDERGGLNQWGIVLRGAQWLLTHLSQEPMLCPRLRSIHLLQAGISDDGLLEFIRSRTGLHLMNINHLSRVHVEFDRPMQVDIMPYLQGLIDNGFDVSLRYHSRPPPDYNTFRYSPSEGNELPGADWAPISTTWNMGPY
ncbi:hypothetical protein B0H10DRAFT_734448 [Mycena sp. CBHHK59/15]|nr:hypothetical protein B0H10DRAFT_734448 [Mycena sp. CBHHK59/15]